MDGGWPPTTAADWPCRCSDGAGQDGEGTVGEHAAVALNPPVKARCGTGGESVAVRPALTVSNLGEQDADSIIGMICPPQVALLGVGAVTERRGRPARHTAAAC